MWVASGHKWLGGPNGTGFAYAAPHLVPKLQPVLLGDHYYSFADTDLTRFESKGTSDVVRLLGLAAACELHMRLGPGKIAARQRELMRYYRERLQELPGWIMRTPDVEGENTGMVTISWPPDMVTVPDLREALWEKYQIWIQPDFYYGEPGKGMRVACHFSNSESDI